MVPWNRLPSNVQRTILAMVILSGEAMAASSCRPMVCDPAPPPSVTPTATATAPPIICDPAPPPSVVPQPTPTMPPIICDPAPPPATATPTPTATSTATVTPVRPPVKTPMIFDPPPDPPLAPDSSKIEGAQTARGSTAPLPLAEIRTVSIYWDDSSADEAEGLTFEADSPWPEARYRWTTSGGLLHGHGDRVTWVPPAEPGRYLLQVVADWGSMGLAVDALVLVVDQDGGVTVG